MKALMQVILSAAVIAAAVVFWALNVPQAAVYLERAGLASWFGIEPGAAAAGTGQASGRPRGAGPASVVTVAVTEGSVDNRLEAIGDGRAIRTVSLRAEVSGTIVEIPAPAGGYVNEGDVILRLDDEAEQIALERARLVVEDAREELRRTQQLLGTGTVTEVRLREGELALQTAELAVREAEFDLARRVIEAPISGWMGVVDLSVGDRIATQDVISTITDRSTILIDFRVPERAVGKIAVGMPVVVRRLGADGAELPGAVRAIDNVVDRDSRTLRVQAVVTNVDDALRSGMAFNVTMTFPGERLPAVDPLAVQWSADGSHVWVARDGKAVRVPVVIRQRNAGSVIVEADLAIGEAVITEGVQSLRPGAEVQQAGQDGQRPASQPVS